MNSRQLIKLGVPEYCVKTAIVGIQSSVASGEYSNKQIKPLIRRILESPQEFVEHSYFGTFASDLLEASV